VRTVARQLYYGIMPKVGVYFSADGLYTNFEDWPLYKLVQAQVANEPGGTAYFLTIQVGDGSESMMDRNKARLGNNLGVPVGHPSLLGKKPNANEYIMLRVLRSSAGKLEIQGMIKGTEEATAAHPIAKDTYIGVTMSGSGRDHGPSDKWNDKTVHGHTDIKPALSNAEIENLKTIKSQKADPATGWRSRGGASALGIGSGLMDRDILEDDPSMKYTDQYGGRPDEGGRLINTTADASALLGR